MFTIASKYFYDPNLGITDIFLGLFYNGSSQIKKISCEFVPE